MTTWTRKELEEIGMAHDLQIAPLGRDGKLQRPATIWVVRIGEDLNVRSAYRQNSAWFRHAKAHRGGRIRADGIEKEVTFSDAERELNEEIDAAYRAKYQRYGAQYVDMMVGSEARAATIKLLPL